MIIIGAGIAGLSAGCYGQMNGYHTRIFEMHNKPGGLCTSWKRGDYTTDGCLHWLVGSSPETNFYRIWEELGAIQGRRMVDHDEFVRIEGAEGKAFPLSFGDLPNFPMMAMLMTLAWMHLKSAGYPIGGSLEFSGAIERRYLDLGGEIHYRSRVTKILVETRPCQDLGTSTCAGSGWSLEGASPLQPYQVEMWFSSFAIKMGSDL